MLCARFHIAWHEYGALTMREIGVLTELLAEEHRAAEAGRG